MASPAIAPLPPSAAPSQGAGRHRTPGTPLGLRKVDQGLRRWPGTSERRWLLRLVLGLPMVVVALQIAGRQPPAPVNANLAAASASIQWGTSDLHWISKIWPPIPVGLAGLVHGNLVALSVIGALCTGGILHSVAERMVLRDWPAWTVVLAVVTLLATPPMIFLATTDLSEFLGLVLLAIALNGFLRFAVYGRTEGGFSAGLLLGIATACAVSVAVHALTMAAAAPLIARKRYRGRRGAGWATAAVIAFPALAALACWTFLEWRFTGRALTTVRLSGAFTFPGGVGPALVKAMADIGLLLLLTPVLWVSFVLLVQRSVFAALGMLAPLPGLVITLWLGFRPYTGLSVILLSCLALFSVAGRPTRRVQLVMAAALVLQWVLTVTVTTGQIPVLTAWWQQIR